MQALTLHAPWAWAVMYGGKDVENRSWSPPDRILGQRIAIHAGMACVAEDRDDLVEMCKNVPQQFTRGAILGTVQIVGYFDEEGRGVLWKGDELETVRLPELTRSEWFGGPVGWVLRDPQPLSQPIPHKGALGLWHVKEPALSELRNATRAA